MVPACCLLSLALAAQPARPERPEPRVLVGDALPDGAVARLGPQAFRHAGAANVLHSTGTQTVWYSPDGKRVAVTSSAGVYVWDAAGNRLVWVASDGRTVAALVGFHPGGDVIVECRRKHDDGAAGAYRIDPGTGKVRTAIRPDERRRFIAASPDGKFVFSRAGDNELTAETVADDLDTGKEAWRKRHPEMSWMKPSSDGSRLVTWTPRAEIRFDVLDAATGKTVGTFVHPESGCTPTWTGGGVAVGPKAERVIVAHSWDNGFSVFEAGTEKPVARLAGSWYDNAFLTPDAKTAVLVRGRNGETVEVWDAAARKMRSSASRQAGRTVALSPDGTTLVAAAGYGVPPFTLHFFDVATGKKRPISPEPFTQAQVVWYLPDGTLASADENLQKPVKWAVKAGVMTPLPAGTKPPDAPKPAADFKPPEGTNQIVVAPGGKRAVGYRFDPEELDSSPGDTYLGLFDEKGKVVMSYLRIDHTDGAIWTFAPDGKTFVIARGDGTITLFDSDSGQERRTLRHGGPVTSMAYSPDGRHLATACGDGPILVWDVGGGKKP